MGPFKQLNNEETKNRFTIKESHLIPKCSEYDGTAEEEDETEEGEVQEDDYEDARRQLEGDEDEDVD